MDTDYSRTEKLLGSISLAEFMESYWEKNPLHISRSSTTHFSPLLSLSAIETVLSTQALFFPSVQMTQSGTSIDASEYTDESRRILPHKIIELHRNGATIVISQAHEKFSELASFRRQMQGLFNLRCQTNVYLSSPGKKGFNAHYDSHDVFILQVSGSKVFNFYDGGIHLPYSHESFDTEKHIAGALSHSITMEPGDTLYIPRGVMHDAVATDKPSLHITLGVHAITQRDLLVQLIQRVTDENSAYRSSIPTNLPTQIASAESDTIEGLSHCLSPKITSDTLLEVLSEMLDNDALDSASDCTDMLQISGSPSLETSSKTSTDAKGTEKSSVATQALYLKPNNILSVERTENSIRIRTHGQVLEFTNPLLPLVDQLLEGSLLDINSHSNISIEEMNVLVNRLKLANLLVSKN